MSSEPGGIATSLGDQYERRFGVAALIDLLRGRLAQVWWQPESGTRGGADFELVDPAQRTEHVQLKRQHKDRGNWTVATLSREGVLAAAARLLDADPTATFTFSSADPAVHLRDICDQLERHGQSDRDFMEQKIRVNKSRVSEFEALLRRWDLDPEVETDQTKAMNRLRRMSFVTEDVGAPAARRLVNQVSDLLSGDGEATIALLDRFLTEHIGRPIVREEVLRYLEAQGVSQRDLLADTTVPVAIGKRVDEFIVAETENLIGSRWIPRGDSQEIVGQVTSERPPNLVLVHGRGGAGKSGVMLQLAQSLRAASVPLLTLSFASQPPQGTADAYGESLQLKTNPAVALRAIAHQRRAVLLIDQLDAVRLTGPAAQAAWSTARGVLSAAMADPLTTVVVACRTFDLENDPQISGWVRRQERGAALSVLRVPVGELSSESLEGFLKTEFEVELESLPDRLSKLLTHPGTLAVYCDLLRAGVTPSPTSNRTQLLARLLGVLKQKAAQEHRVPESEVARVLQIAADFMERSGQQRVGQSRLSDCKTAVEACCSVGLLVRRGSSIGFPHQSYLDFLVAEAALRDSGASPSAVLHWVKEDQGLNRRDRLRQLIALMRDQEPLLASQSIRAILEAPSVRFHLKLLILSVLGEASEVAPCEIRLVLRLADDLDWCSHVQQRVLWGSSVWFDALNAAGAWSRWLSNPDAEPRRTWLKLVLSVMEARASNVDDLLRPLLATHDGVEDLGNVLWPGPESDSPLVGDVRLHEVERGRWGMPDVFLDSLAKKDPDRALQLVAASLRGILRRGLGAADGEDTVQALRDHAFDREVRAASQRAGLSAFREFAKLLLTAERLMSRTLDRLESDEMPVGPRWRLRSLFSDVIEIMKRLTAAAVVGMSEQRPEGWREVLEDRRVEDSEGLRAAVAIGLAHGPTTAADAATRWLIAQPNRMAAHHIEYESYGIAAELIERHSGACSDDVLAELESKILGYWPQEEIDWYRERREIRPDRLACGNCIGAAQHVLLSSIPEDRLSPRARERRLLWAGKFGITTRTRVRWSHEVSAVGSCIPPDRLPKLSDNFWLRTVQQTWDGRRRRRMGPEMIGEATHKQFAGSFGGCAKGDPRKFAKLFLRFPKNVPQVYLIRLLGALGDKAVDPSACDPGDLVAVMERAAVSGDADVLRAACWAMEHHPTAPWGDAGWQVLRVSAEHPDPAPDRAVRLDARPDLTTTCMNCVRGVAALALASLLREHQVGEETALPLVERLAGDPHPAVRVGALYAASALSEQSEEDARRLLLCAAEHESDDLLASPVLNHMVARARWDKAHQLDALFARMVQSNVPDAARLGAQWVTADHYEYGRSSELYSKCVDGTAVQRGGVARGLHGVLLWRDVDQEAVEAELLRLFSDDDEAVRQEASKAALDEKVLAAPVGPRLALAYVESDAFLDHPERLALTLERDGVDLSAYTDVVLAVASRFSEELAPRTRDMTSRLAGAGDRLSLVLLRLYDTALKAGDRGTAEKCLDAWDTLLERQVGRSESHLDHYDPPPA